MDLDSRRWDARYGWDLISGHASQFQDAVVVSSPSAMALVEPLLVHRPIQVVFQRGMRDSILEEMLAALPEAKRMLAIGGGNALDVGKYLAWKKGWPLVMIPTIVSTGAVFQSPLALRRPDRFEWIMGTVAPEYLLFDYGVIRRAPAHLNCSGMAECICYLGQVGAWKWWLDRNLEAPTWDQGVADEILDWVDTRVREYRQSLDENGQPREAGIRVAAEVNRERYDLKLHSLKVGHSLDHAFCITFEWVHGRELLHGEAVALGSLINGWLYGWGFDRTKALLEACRTRFRPAEIGCTHQEVLEALNQVAAFADLVGHPRNYFHYRGLDRETFDAMMAAIEA